MERKNTPRQCLLIFLSTLHNSAVHNMAFNGPASLLDKDMEPVVNRQGWVNVLCSEQGLGAVRGRKSVLLF